MNDLYAELGLPRTASLADVKRAYRKAAMKTHPDRAGDKDAFHRAILAYKVLSDPEARAKYDRTGEVPQDRIDRTMQEIMQTVAQVFDAALGGLVSVGKNPTEHDLAAEMKELVKRRIKQVEQERQGPEKILAVLTSLLDRFTVSEGENDMEALIVQQVDGLKKTLEAKDKEKELNVKVLDFLKRYKYRHEKPKKATTTAPAFSTITFRIS